MTTKIDLIDIVQIFVFQHVPYFDITVRSGRVGWGLYYDCFTRQAQDDTRNKKKKKEEKTP